MTDEITSRLARVSGLGVISRTSAVQYDRSGKTVKEIGSDLGVGFVLEGSVRWERQEDGPGRVRISPRLIRVADDTHLWAQSYERDLEGIFETQSEIAQAVVDQLGVTLLPHERSGVESRPTQSLAAYQAYLRGRELLANLDYPREDLELAVEMLERAVDLDPEFVGAHAELSRAHTRMFYVDYDSTPERLEKARESADRALALDPTAPDGHKALGKYYQYGLHDHEKALEELTRAAELLPNDSEIAHAMGDVAWEQGRWNEARAHLERAAELDPRNAACAESLGLFFRHVRQYDRAVRWFDTQISLAPDSASGYLGKSAVYLDWGLPDRAREALEGAPRTEDRHLVWGWVVLEIQDGHGQAALDRLLDAPDVLEFMWGQYPTALLPGHTRP
jgi:TolB-like protein